MTGSRQKEALRVEIEVLKAVYTKLVGGYEYFDRNSKARIRWHIRSQPV